MAKSYGSYGQKYLKVAWVFICHLGLIALSISGIYGLELLIHYYWGHADPLLFDRVPLRYPFQFIDLVLILLFGYRAVLEMNDILKE
jgi:hypothetical protein